MKVTLHSELQLDLQHDEGFFSSFSGTEISKSLKQRGDMAKHVLSFQDCNVQRYPNML